MGTPNQKAATQAFEELQAEYGRERGYDADKLVALAPRLLKRPTAKIKNGQIICDHCDQPAVTIHLLPYQLPEPWQRIEASCDQFDPGGYGIDLQRLYNEPLHWLRHLMEKRTGPEGFDPVSLILEWLGYRGCALVDQSHPT